MDPWVFFDVGNLVWRAWHTTGKKGLAHGGTPTGVTFGFLREVKLQLDRHQTSNAVFCFDSKVSVRKQEFAGYKASRSERAFTPEDEMAYKLVQKQMRLIREDYLPSLGFKNLLRYKGFEADDAIACGVIAVRHLSHGVGGDVECHVISSDKDLWQLLTYPGVTCWRPGADGAAYTKEQFKGEWDLDPAMWATVKAIAGCSSDDVPGVKGVGEKTAASYLRKRHTKDDLTKLEKLADEFMLTEQWKLNMRLVSLPHQELRRSHPDGAELFPQEAVRPRAWNKLFERLGIKSIV
jgi:DNA polymerase-1